MNTGPAFEFADDVTYEEAVAGLVDVIRRSRGRGEGSEPAPADVARRDQMGAAANEQMERLYAMGSLMGYPVTNDEMSDDVLARVSLAVMACHPCPHVKQNPAQPHVAVLAIHRLVCERCAQTHIKEPAENDDRCDWCWSHGHTTFWPIRMSYGPTVLMGDACDGCNTKLKAGTVFEAGGDE